MTSSILGDIKVIDFSRYIAGPYCAALLSHLGADVIRVEKRGGAEDRHVTPLQESGEPVSALFQQTGANKRSLTLDIKHAQAKEVVRRLVAGADVVVANMPPPALKRAGLDYETLRGIKADIILTTQTGYGHQGPWAGRGGFDGVGQAMSGASYFAGEPGKPVKSAAPYADFGTALFSAYATLAALYEKQRTGQGQHVQASLLGTALSFFNPLLAEHAVREIHREPSGAQGQTSAPSSIFQTKDGQVLIHVVGNGLFERVATLIGATEWITEPRFANDQLRGDAAGEICGRVADWCAVRSTEQVLSDMNNAAVPCGPVLPIPEVLKHEQIQAMSFVKEFAVPHVRKPVPVVDFPVAMSGNDVGQKRRAPLIGEHTEDVLKELGFNSEEIKSLRELGVI